MFRYELQNIGFVSDRQKHCLFGCQKGWLRKVMPQIRMVAPTASDGILAAVLGFVSGLPLCLVMMILGAVFLF